MQVDHYRLPFGAICDVLGTVKRIPFIRLSALYPVMAFLQKGGADVDRYLSIGGLSPSTEAPMPWSERFLPTAKAFELARLIARREGIDHLGLKVGDGIALEDVPELEPFLAHSLNLEDLLRRLSKFLSYLNTGAQSSLDYLEDGDSIRFCHRQSIPPGATLDAYPVNAMIEIVRLVAGPNWRPKRVWCPGAPTNTAENYEAFSDAKIEVNTDFAGIEIPRSMLGCPVISRKSTRQSSAYLDSRMEDSVLPSDLLAQVSTVVRSSFGSEIPTIVEVAEMARCSVRSLQVDLANSGTTYGRLVDTHRYEEARRLLATDDDQISEISWHLAYRDPAHFTRAFRRWSGKTPTQWRQIHQGV